MPFRFIYLHSGGVLLQKLVTAYVWEHMLSLPCKCIWRTGLGHLYVELLACISVVFGCFLLVTLILSILVSCWAALTWKIAVSLTVVATTHFRYGGAFVLSCWN